MTLYLNAYLDRQVYGGPEEGGWWYYAGDPISSVPFELPGYDPSRENYEQDPWVWEAITQLCAGAAEELKNEGGRHDTLIVKVEKTEAAPYPAERPYYC